MAGVIGGHHGRRGCDLGSRCRLPSGGGVSRVTLITQFQLSWNVSSHGRGSLATLSPLIHLMESLALFFFVRRRAGGAGVHLVLCSLDQSRPRLASTSFRRMRGLRPYSENSCLVVMVIALTFWGCSRPVVEL